MTEEINKELIELIKKARFEPFPGLSDEDLELLRQKSKNLSFNEKAALFNNKLIAQGTLLHDPAGLFEAVIRIDDRTTEAREKRPFAYIEFTDGVNSIVEVVDIFESVKSDASNIGHPVIVFAIQHWQKLIQWGKYTKTDVAYNRTEAAKEVKIPLEYRLVENAETNLKSISKSLVDGAIQQKVPKEVAFASKIKDLKIGERQTYLYVAWERLANKHILQTDELDKRVEKIELFLKQIPSYQNEIVLNEFESEFGKYGSVESTISIAKVIDFLKTDGSGFVFDENNEKSLRPKWTVFRNAFIEWYFGNTAETVKKYQKGAKKQQISNEPYIPRYIGPLPQTSVYQIFFNIFTNELVKVGAPIHCSKEIADSHRFAELIGQRGTN